MRVQRCAGSDAQRAISGARKCAFNRRKLIAWHDRGLLAPVRLG